MEIIIATLSIIVVTYVTITGCVAKSQAIEGSVWSVTFQNRIIIVLRVVLTSNQLNAWDILNMLLNSVNFLQIDQVYVKLRCP